MKLTLDTEEWYPVYKLGTSKYSFDLVVLEEDGQKIKELILLRDDAERQIYNLLTKYMEYP